MGHNFIELGDLGLLSAQRGRAAGGTLLKLLQLGFLESNLFVPITNLGARREAGTSTELLRSELLGWVLTPCKPLRNKVSNHMEKHSVCVSVCVLTQKSLTHTKRV
jgi:hypothetical protein